MFSVPTGGNHSYPMNADSACLTEDELNIIIDYEEENTRLGNFDRIYPLQQNAAHYAKFFEYERPSNELLSKYLRLLPNEGTVQSFQAVQEMQDSPGVKANNSCSPTQRKKK